ncbi:phosphatidate cytidylyltransferase [Neobittarella massiliensis]|uniref:Phosphatidate cytidylyltransferase n=1 Tax=Neobittarella massiliensis (ex Bilen et al. 2018) TaxID=2041842 RepID=A0A8J6IPL5_9FIRM|nr:phosphatidate cytidylyltransferase [Neobittarella massiliensis]MBC3515633.1 phosphatidate cytidylyltransferase [Neobittarella massiliensis]
MKTRILSAMGGLVVLAIAVLLFDTVFFNAIIGAIVLLAIFEVCRAVKLKQHLGLYLWCGLFGLFVVFYEYLPLGGFLPFLAGLFCFTVGVLSFTVFHFQDVPYANVAMLYLETMAILFGFGSAVYMRTAFGPDALFLLFVALGSAWLTDSGAYFCGRLFGKHKMSPHVSPNKTVEGAVGGVVVCALLMAGIAALYTHFNDGVSSINHLYLALTVAVASLLGMMGDLVASSLKRQMQIKDYGNIMPGHGGAMDRFDSVLFTAPTVLFMASFLPIIAR